MSIRLGSRGMYAAGLGFMALAWVKNRLAGYSTPNTVNRGDVAGAVNYVRDTVRSWERFLSGKVDVRGRDVLELCPGSTLGTGALLLAKGARSYHAVDAFRLADADDTDFLLRVLSGLDPNEYLPQDVERAQTIIKHRNAELFDYRVERSFDIDRLSGGKSFDLQLSCAAFEHYDDIDRTIEQLSHVARPGCVSAHIVDFQTHSRWIRQNDPNNIYRYDERLYRLFGFPGRPNRQRPDDYLRAFERNGWDAVEVVAAQTVAAQQLPLSTTGLLARFNRPEADMTMLEGVVIARRPAPPIDNSRPH